MIQHFVFVNFAMLIFSIALISNAANVGFGPRPIVNNPFGNPFSRPNYRHFCEHRPESPKIDYEDCLKAYLDLNFSPQFQPPLLWGGITDPNEPGYLPLPVKRGSCQIELTAPHSLKPSSWVLQDWNTNIESLIHDCVKNGTRKGGYTVIGPAGHQIFASLGSNPNMTDGGAVPVGTGRPGSNDTELAKPEIESENIDRKKRR